MNGVLGGDGDACETLPWNKALQITNACNTTQLKSRRSETMQGEPKGDKGPESMAHSHIHHIGNGCASPAATLSLIQHQKLTRSSHRLLPRLSSPQMHHSAAEPHTADASVQLTRDMRVFNASAGHNAAECMGKDDH